MKFVIVLLATLAAFAYGVPHANLKSIMKEVQCLHKETLDTVVYDTVFVKDLKRNKTDHCEAEFFCQTERILSGVELPKAFVNCSVDKLIRNLKQYNNGVNCTVPTKGDELILRSFLDDLAKCMKKVFSRS